MRPADTAVFERLIQLTRIGDPAAREQLAAQACDRLRSLTRKMLRADFPRLRRWEETDDVHQNAMIRLHRALADVTPESARHFFNLAATQIRRELLNLSAHYFGPEGAGVNHHTDGAADAESGVLRNAPAATDEPQTVAEWGDFHAAVGRLPEDEREVFDLLWYQSLDQAEAAVVMNTSIRTVKRRWQAAKLRLHDLLGGSGPGGDGHVAGR